MKKILKNYFLTISGRSLNFQGSHMVIGILVFPFWLLLKLPDFIILFLGYPLNKLADWLNETD